MLCNALQKKTEYAGRPAPGETKKKIDVRKTIPPVPFSLSPSCNVYKEENYSKN